MINRSKMDEKQKTEKTQTEQAPKDSQANNSREMAPAPGTERITDWSQWLTAIRVTKGLQRQAPPLRPVSRHQALPLSFSQERLWFLHHTNPGSPAYNTARAYRIMGRLNVEALEQSLNRILQRHEILRTVYPIVDGKPIQQVAPVETEARDKAMLLSIIDLQGMGEADREKEAQRLLIEEAQKPFDLAQGPLLRAILLRLDHEDQVMLLVSHQIVFDGESWTVFNRDLSVQYDALASGTHLSLKDLRLQYADFAAWQREWLKGEVLLTLTQHWREQVHDGFPPLLLPTDRPLPANETYQSGAEPLALSRSLTQALKALSQEEGVTLFVALVAALQTLLHHYTGQSRMLLLSPVTIRDQRETRSLIGLFTNLIPFSADLTGNPSFRGLLRRVQEVAVKAFAYKDLPFGELLKALPMDAGPGQPSPFRFLFLYQNSPSRHPVLTGLNVRPLPVHLGSTTVDLALSMEMENENQGLVGTMIYKTDLFQGDSIKQMIVRFQSLLEEIVANPDRPVSDLIWNPQHERQTGRAVPDDKRAISLTPPAARTPSRSTPAAGYVAPRDPLEHQLVKIWEDVLGMRPIGVRDNFMTLGGHSLLAVQMLARLEGLTGSHVELMTLFQAPTIEQLANVLRQEHNPTQVSPLVLLQAGKSQPPFFCLPGNLGNVFTDLDRLARHLGPERSFYGLQDGIHHPYRIEELAGFYLEQIRNVQPEGPYLLGGVCSGGIVAFEMARQLCAQGQEVGLLALVETLEPRVPSLRAYAGFALYFLDSLLKLLGRLWHRTTPMSSIGISAFSRLKLKALANVWAIVRYNPAPYPGPAHLFITQESLERQPDPRIRWNELAAGGAEIHLIPGTHNTITHSYGAVPEEAHMARLAAELQACIDNALWR